MAFEHALEYPLFDVEEAVYIGPEHLPPLTSSLRALLRDLEVRWESFEELTTEEQERFGEDAQAAERALADELRGTGWALAASTSRHRGRRKKDKR